MTLSARHHTLQPVRVCHSIRIEQRQPQRSALLCSDIVACRKAQIPGLRKKTVAWHTLGLQVVDGAVSRRIVDQQHLKIPEGLRSQGIERLLQVRFAIIIHNDDRDGDHV